MAELRIETQQDGDLSVIWLIGELDSYSAPRVRDVLGKFLASATPHVRLHLSGVEYIDSMGLGVLVGALKKTEDEVGTLEIVAPSPQVAQVLRVTGLDKVFTILGGSHQPMEIPPLALV